MSKRARGHLATDIGNSVSENWGVVYQVQRHDQDTHDTQKDEDYRDP
jgi:hypothetical protein